MKHHVFFFLLTVFFPICAMDKYETDTCEREFSKLIKRCILYNQYCPNTFNIKKLEESKNQLFNLSAIDQKKYLREAFRCVPCVRVVHGEVFFYWKSDNENKSTENRICST
ncbi:MAG TPA: hypothetical protein VKU36_00135 [Candidatus Babeliales bacterium]|nr:hypothetical protein [Candidatus Babeliales bacterium]